MATPVPTSRPASSRTRAKKSKNLPIIWKIFENTHEAIIDEETFARVQDVTIIYNYIGILPANSLYNIMNVKAA